MKESLGQTKRAEAKPTRRSSAQPKGQAREPKPYKCKREVDPADNTQYEYADCRQCGIESSESH